VIESEAFVCGLVSYGRATSRNTHTHARAEHWGRPAAARHRRDACIDDINQSQQHWLTPT